MRTAALLVVLMLACTSAQAEELCSEWERRIEPDMQIEESEFTLKAAEEALERLARLVREPTHELSWIAEGNSILIIRGWLLKKTALEALESQEAGDDVPEVADFCEFLVNEASYRD